jgi:surfeit locus 1 family protein
LSSKASIDFLQKLIDFAIALMPITAFALGTWQIQRLKEKTELITRFKDALSRPPLPLPPVVDESVVHEFDYRRIRLKGKWRHDQEMLVGPRMRDGHEGFIVITPLERGDEGTTILVSRGWISKKYASQKTRRQLGPEALPDGEVEVEGLLREPFKKNMFTPDNKPEEGKFYFPDIKEMSELVGSQPIWIEETGIQDLISFYDKEVKGIPIARAPEVNLRNNHLQYIVTW